MATIVQLDNRRSGPAEPLDALIALVEDDLKAVIKPQFVESIRKASRKATVSQILTKRNDRDLMDYYVKELARERD